MQFNKVSNPNIVQTSPKGRKFRTFGISRINQKEWAVHIKYIDNDDLKTLLFDKNDKMYDVIPYQAPDYV